MFKKSRQNDSAGGKLRGSSKQVFPGHAAAQAELDAALASSASIQQQQYTSYASRSTTTAPPAVLKDAVSHSHSSTPSRDPAPSAGPSTSSSHLELQVRNILQSPSAFSSAPNPSLSASYLTPTKSKRASVQSIASYNSAATSRSSLERLSNDYHGAGETSTLASSQAPPSTESLGLGKPAIPNKNNPQDVPISEIQPSWQRRASQEAMYDRAAASSKPTAGAHQRPVSSSAAPTTAIVSSDYESSSRTRALRRMKGTSLMSTRGATSTSDGPLPAPKEEEPAYGSAAALARSQPPKQNDSEMRHSFLSTHSRKPSEDLQAGSSGHNPEVQSPPMTVKPSIAQSLAAPGGSQRAPSSSNQRSAMSSSAAYQHPQLLKLKETSIPQLASPALSSAGSSRWSGYQSPQSSTLMPAASDRTSLFLPSTSTASRIAHAPSSSATLYSIPQDNTASTTLMTSSTSSRASRVEVDPSKVYTIIPPSTSPVQSPHSPASSYVTALAETVVGPQTPCPPSSSAIARPQSPVARPGSAQVQAIFSPASIASRLPTPHPNRGNGLPRPPSEMMFSGITPISTPPPLPPASTRPDIIGSPTKPAPMSKQASLRAQMIERLKSTTSPTPQSVISPTFSTMPGPSKHTSVPGQTQPQASVLRSYGLEKPTSVMSQTPAPQRRISHDYAQSEYAGSDCEEEHEEYDVVQSTQVVQVTTKTVRVQSATRTVTSPVPVATNEYASLPSPAPSISAHESRKSAYTPPPQQQSQASSSKSHGIFDMFRSKSPPQRSATVPPNLQSSSGSLHNMHAGSPSPRPRTPGGGSKHIFPFRLFHKPTKSISDASVVAVIDRGYQHDGAMSSCSSLVNSASEVGTGGPPSPPMRDPMMAVLDWRGKEEEEFQKMGRTKRRPPGVTWDLPSGHHGPSGGEDDDARPRISMSMMRRSKRAQMATAEDDDP